MKLQVSSPIEYLPSSKATLISNQLMRLDDDFEIASYLLNFFLNDNLDEMEEMNNWNYVLDRLDGMLEKYQPLVSTSSSSMHTSDQMAKFILCSILRFLAMLFKVSKQKRFFLSFESVGNLMSSTDLDISELAIELIYVVCIPSSSISLNLNEEFVDSIEVPEIVTTDAIQLFEGFSMLSTDFGVVEYIRGHTPDNMALKPDTLLVSFLPRSESTLPYSCIISVPSTSLPIESPVIDDIGDTINSIATNYNQLTGPELIMICAMYRTMVGFFSNFDYRYRIAKLRCLVFFILVHSRCNPTSPIHDYSKPGSKFVKQLVELADLTSDLSIELNSSNEPRLLNLLALENVLGLLENKLRRRGSMMLQSEILSLLGLAKSSTHDPTPASSEESWISIVTSSCAISTYFFSGSDMTQSSSESSKSSHSAISMGAPDAKKFIERYKPFRSMTDERIGQFIRMGLELFVLSLSLRDASQVVQDMSAIGAISNILHSSLPCVQKVLKKLSNNSTVSKVDSFDYQLQLVVSKALFCLNLCIEKTGYYTAFRECDSLLAIKQLLEIFAYQGLPNAENLNREVSLSSMDSSCIIGFQLDTAAKRVLESTLSILDYSLVKSRNAMLNLQLDGNENESLFQVAYNNFFDILCLKIFRTEFSTNETLWSSIMSILKSVIDSDPPFLAHFLATSYSEELKKAFVQDALFDMRFKKSFADPLCDLGQLLVPLFKLANAICITSEGRSYLHKSKIVNFVLDAITEPSLLLPRSTGLSSERLAKLGKLLAGILQESDLIKQVVKQALNMKLTTLSIDAQNEYKSLNCDEPPLLDSRRMQVLQKLSNVCTVVENLYIDHRPSRQLADFILKEILTVDTIRALVKAFSCTLPASRQLFSQISLNHVSFPHIGNFASAKQIFSLLKYTSSSIPQQLMPILYKEIDETLNLISSCKQSLRVLGVNKLSQEIIENALNSPASRSMKPRSRSRGSSWSQNNGSVLILGVLDCIPHLCVMDPSLKSDFFDKYNDNELEQYVWKFFSYTLLLDWQCLLLSNTIKSSQKLPSVDEVLNTSTKDFYRRIFAYLKSSMLEVCSFGFSKWKSMNLDQSRSKESILEPFCACDSTDDPPENPILRKADRYVLRVTGAGGALIREGIEIEGSRIVMVADVGSTLVATERKINSAGVVRYKTTHGWLSEYRRDLQRNPIVELIEIGCDTAGVDLSPSLGDIETEQSDAELKSKSVQVSSDSSNSSALKEDATKPTSDIMTLREAASHVLIRSQSSIRQVALSLAKLSSQDSHNSGRNHAGNLLISTTLCKIFKGMFKHPISCLQNSTVPHFIHELQLFGSISEVSSNKTAQSTNISNTNNSPSTFQKRSTSSRSNLKSKYFSSTAKKFSANKIENSIRNDSNSEEENLSSDDVWASYMKESVRFAVSSDALPEQDYRFIIRNRQLYSGLHCENDENQPIGKLTKSVSFGLSNDVDDSNALNSTESVQVHFGAACLYFGSVVKQFLLPILEDKNGNMIWNLLRNTMNYGILDSFLDSFLIMSITLYESLNPNNDSTTDDKSYSQISALGRAALHSLPIMLVFIRRLMTGIRCGLTNSNMQLVDEYGPYQANAFMFEVYHATAIRIMPLIRMCIFSYFPHDIQTEWISLLNDFFRNIITPLPPSKDIAPVTAGRKYPPFVPDSPTASATHGITSALRHMLHSRSERLSNNTIQSDSATNSNSSVVQNTAVSVTETSPPPFTMDENVLNLLSDMGFERSVASIAMLSLRSNDLETLAEYLVSHPELQNESSQMLPTNGDSLNRSIPDAFTNEPQEVADNSAIVSLDVGSNFPLSLGSQMESETESVNPVTNIPSNAVVEEGSILSLEDVLLDEDGLDEELMSAIQLSMQSLHFNEARIQQPTTYNSLNANDEHSNTAANTVPNSEVIASTEALRDAIDSEVSSFQTSFNRNQNVSSEEPATVVSIPNQSNMQLRNQRPPRPAGPGAILQNELRGVDRVALQNRMSSDTSGLSQFLRFSSLLSARDASIPTPNFTSDRMGERYDFTQSSHQSDKNKSVGSVDLKDTSLMSETLKDISKDLQALAVPYVVEVCANLHFTDRWGISETNRLIPQLVNFVTMTLIERTATLKFQDVLNIVKNMICNIVSSEISMKYSDQLYGLFCVMKQFLYDNQIRQELESFLDRDYVSTLLNAIIQQFETLLQLHEKRGLENLETVPWECPKYADPAMILMFEILSLPIAHREHHHLMMADGDTNSQDSSNSVNTPTHSAQSNYSRAVNCSSASYSQSSTSHTLPGEGKEEEEGVTLAETKEDKDVYNAHDLNSVSSVGFRSEVSMGRNKQHFHQTNLSSLPTTIFEDIHIVSDELWDKTFELIQKLIAACSTKPFTIKQDNENMPLEIVNKKNAIFNAEAAQALVLLLWLLLGRQKYTVRFLDSNGLSNVFNMDIDFTKSSSFGSIIQMQIGKISSLIVQRCLETSLEIQLEVFDNIKSFFKSLPNDQSVVPVEKFVAHFLSYLHRSAEDFWSVCMNLVTFTKSRVPIEDATQTDKQEKDGPIKSSNNKIKNELNVSLLKTPRNNMLERLRKSATGLEEDNRANAAIKYLLDQLIQLVSIVSSSVETNTSKLLNVSSILDSLSDSILGLRRVSYLIAKMIKSDEILLHSTVSDSKQFSVTNGVNDNLIDFIVSKFISATTPTALVSIDDSTKVDYVPTEKELYSASRFLISLCATRGLARVITLNSILKMFKQKCINLSKSFDGNVDNRKKVKSNNVNSLEEKVSTSFTDTQKNLVVLARLSSLLREIIHFPKSSSSDRVKSTHRDSIAIDSIHYLVVHGNILKLLTQALMDIPLDTPKSSVAFATILDLFEIITRPKVQVYLDKLTVALQQVAITTNSAMNPSEDLNQNTTKVTDELVDQTISKPIEHSNVLSGEYASDDHTLRRLYNDTAESYHSGVAISDSMISNREPRSSEDGDPVSLIDFLSESRAFDDSTPGSDTSDRNALVTRPLSWTPGTIALRNPSSSRSSRGSQTRNNRRTNPFGPASHGVDDRIILSQINEQEENEEDESLNIADDFELHTSQIDYDPYHSMQMETQPSDNTGHVESNEDDFSEDDDEYMGTLNAGHHIQYEVEDDDEDEEESNHNEENGEEDEDLNGDHEDDEDEDNYDEDEEEVEDEDEIDNGDEDDEDEEDGDDDDEEEDEEEDDDDDDDDDNDDPSQFHSHEPEELNNYNLFDESNLDVDIPTHADLPWDVIINDSSPFSNGNGALPDSLPSNLGSNAATNYSTPPQMTAGNSNLSTPGQVFRVPIPYTEVATSNAFDSVFQSDSTGGFDQLSSIIDHLRRLGANDGPGNEITIPPAIFPDHASAVVRNFPIGASASQFDAANSWRGIPVESSAFNSLHFARGNHASSGLLQRVNAPYVESNLATSPNSDANLQRGGLANWLQSVGLPPPPTIAQPQDPISFGFGVQNSRRAFGVFGGPEPLNSVSTDPHTGRPQSRRPIFGQALSSQAGGTSDSSRVGRSTLSNDVGENMVRYLQEFIMEALDDEASDHEEPLEETPSIASMPVVVVDDLHPQPDERNLIENAQVNVPGDIHENEEEIEPNEGDEEDLNEADSTSQSTGITSRGPTNTDGYSLQSSHSQAVSALTFHSSLAVQVGPAANMLHSITSRRQNTYFGAIGGSLDSIPPLIEIDSNRDDQINEELSVITLPQEGVDESNYLIEADDRELLQGNNSSSSSSSSVLTVPRRIGSTPVYGNDIASINPAEIQQSSTDSVGVEISNTQSNLTTHSVVTPVQDESIHSSTDNQSQEPKATHFQGESSVLNPITDAIETETTQTEEENLRIENVEEVSNQLAHEVTNEIIDAHVESLVSNSASNRYTCPNGYDPDVFYSLPEEMQQEIVEQQGDSTQQMRSLAEAAGLDYEFIASLPDNIRQEVLDQARREQHSAIQETQLGDANATSSSTAGNDMDNATFLASLTLELRAEVLLTADPEFLATLPPELVAEAQVLRERAASNWQRREISSRRGGISRPSAGQGFGVAFGQSGPNPSNIALIGGDAGEEFYEEEYEEDADNDLNMNQTLHRSGRRIRISSAGNNNRRGNPGPNRAQISYRDGVATDGIFKLLKFPSINMKIPRTAMVAITRLLVISSRKSASLALFHKLYQNFTTTVEMKDQNLKLLVSLLVFNTGMLRSVVQNLSDNEHDETFFISRIQNDEQMVDLNVTHRPKVTVKNVDNASNSDIMGKAPRLIPIAIHRILLILTEISKNTAAVVYLLLHNRDENGNIVLNHDNQSIFNSNRDESNQQSISSLHANIIPVHSVGSKLQHNSFNSLLESVLSLFSSTVFQSDVNLLECLSNLVGIITAPLDGLPDTLQKTPSSSPLKPLTTSSGVIDGDGGDNFTTIQSDISHSATIDNSIQVETANIQLVDNVASPIQTTAPIENNLPPSSPTPTANDFTKVDVPRVLLRRESLNNLCEVLMSDLCSRKVFVTITNCISRLAKIAGNDGILLELIYDVIVDLALQSQTKLEILIDSLVKIRENFLLKINTGEEDLRIEDESVISRVSRTVDGMNTVQPIPSNLLPIGEIGGKQHERLLRVIQTLKSMAEKTNRAVLDVAPVDHLNPLWNKIDDVFQQLKYYLISTGEDVQTVGKPQHSNENSSSSSSNSSSNSSSSNRIGQATTSNQKPNESSRSQTTLTSALNRILPAVEAFFLIHTSDYLTEKAVSAAVAQEVSSSNTLNTSITGEKRISSCLQIEDGKSDQLNTSSEVKVNPNNLMPGYRFRITPEYIRNNLSLTNADAIQSTKSIEERVPFQSSRSLLRFNSFSIGSTKGINFLTSNAQKLLSFVQSHQGILNLLIKSRPALLETAFASLVRIVQLRSFLQFENKRKYFFHQLKRMNAPSSRRGLHLQIRRNQVFEDTFHQLQIRTPEEMRGRLQVNFYGEEGVDAGGLTREWYMILSREIFNPNYALFTVAADGVTFQPNPLSTINTNHLDYFKFVGRVIGKAICDGQLMDAHFTRSFYKHLLGMPVDFSDIESTEPDYYKILKQISENSLEDLMIDLTFSAEIQKFGKMEVVDLVTNGRNIPVTDENKGEYIKLIAHHRMTSGIRAQIDSFLSGFYDLVPPELICIFSPTELELLICGLPDVNLDELSHNTEYHQYKSSDEMIVWFWEILNEFNPEERASFLQFVTGTSKVPLGGFANLQGMRGNQKFSIHKAYGSNGVLPTAHTCFNQLDLPVYSSREQLRDKLMLAIKEGAEGFGFA